MGKMRWIETERLNISKKIISGYKLYLLILNSNS